jgi:hypothetical protein
MNRKITLAETPSSPRRKFRNFIIPELGGLGVLARVSPF